LEYTIYETVIEARIAIGEVAGAGYECFTDKGRALAFVERCRFPAITLAKPTPSMVPAPGLLPYSVPGQHHIYSQARYDELHPNIHAYPPPLLHGADASKREEDEIYGLNIGSVTELEAGFVDGACIDTWAYGGFVTRIVLVALNDYVSLHFHVLAQANSGMHWSYIQAEIDFHVGKLSSPRGLYPTRTQALCAIAIYLRDGAARIWSSATLQRRRKLELYTLANRVGDGGTGTSAGRTSICSRCLTALHGGSVAACPWWNDSDPIARQSGSQALLRLADPTTGE
jgi:hypothetical protein